MSPEESPLLASLLPRVLPLLKSHISSKDSNTKPFFIALTGPQGSGKTTVTTLLSNSLSSSLNVNIVTVSIDDFYLPHSQLEIVGQKNELWKQRGLPGTHDVALASEFFSSLLDIKGNEAIKVPQYDKSAYSGAGDRASISTWPEIHPSKVDVVILEGWCVGFTSLGPDLVHQRWAEAKSSQSETHFVSRYTAEDVQAMDSALASYNRTFMDPNKFEMLIVLDASSSQATGSSISKFCDTVYTWRLQQEHALLKSHSSGMTDDQVRKFVEGYMPGYELYLPGLRSSLFFGDAKGKKQLRVLLDDQRNVVEIVEE